MKPKKRTTIVLGEDPTADQHPGESESKKNETEETDHHRIGGGPHRGSTSRRKRIHLTGPNVCRERGSSSCCPGWAFSYNRRMCLRPLCYESRCGSGLCIAPNTCLCEDGKLKPICNMESADLLLSLSGPNVCREKGSSSCCPGWALSHNRRMCLRPLCDEGRCGSGLCKAPNTCLCEDGKLKPACNMESAEQKCTVRCMHGGKCVNNQCQCTYGYTGPNCGQPICGSGCLNGGRCITPGRCACVYGYTGMRCERDYRKGPCFLTRVNNICINEVASDMCTKLYCCATVGQGWGSPCQECPAPVGNCTRGLLPPHCTDINECEIMRGLCEGGTCVNTDGSFRCECPPGFEYNSETHQCRKVLNRGQAPDTNDGVAGQNCNYADKTTCPLNNNCKVDKVIYRAGEGRIRRRCNVLYRLDNKNI